MFNLSEAMNLLLACELSYEGDSDKTTELLQFEKISIEVIGDFYCYMGVNKEGEGLLVPRGTATLGGWITDSDALLVQCSSFPGRVHEGFHQAFMEFWPWIQRVRQPKMRVYGHSLGGALGVLFSEALGCPLFTLGCPRVGDALFAESCKSPHLRIVNDLDPFPHLPAFPYVHSCPEWRLPYGGELSLWHRISNLWSHLRKGLMPTIVKALHDHTLVEYRKALERYHE